MPEDAPISNNSDSSAKPLVRVIAEECFNYAAWQNAVPLLREVIVENPTDDELSSLTVELTPSPSFARGKSWKVDRVGAGQSVTLRDIDLDIDAEYLDRLDEAVRGRLGFRLVRQDETLAERKHELRVLARDEWGGMGSMGELLPAFVTPNDPALAPLLKSASESLERHGHPAGLDGYQSGDPNRSYMLAAALWSAVASRSLTYANPPSSFEQVGQKTRRIQAVLADGLATCLDSTLLFASGLEAVGLNPVLVMTEGHCFAGVWLVEKTLKKLNEADPSELRKAVAAKELIVFETTLVTHRPAAGFPEAMQAAEAALGESREHEFVGALDVARARMSQVRPLASHGERAEGESTEVETGHTALPAMPNYERPTVEEPEPAPTTPAGRIDRWQRKLLDLSLRNRLLNFRPTKQTVPVVCPDVSRLEDLLADGTKMRLVSLRDENQVGERDKELHQQRTQKDFDLEFAREALARNEVACPVEARDLELRLTALYRKVKNDLAEGGSNTLYLAVGFLRWKQQATDERTYRAPLLLVPVKLTRRSASSPYYLAHHEDDVRFNATLLQLLKKDFDCDLTAMESDLPTDDSGVDVPKVLDRMRRAVRDIPGFEVVEDAAVASFSFAKYLMWKDLVERVGQLERNRVVRHLVNEPDKAFEAGGDGPMPRPHEMDTRYEPSEIVHPLPADSSQLTAVMAASEGHDMVIVGPPGTGKSQTIANIIAQCLAVGKTVLFVAEKTAALDVVHRRLKEHGLGDCCVELHSSKAERRRLLDQLEASWKRRQRPNNQEWIEVSERLKVRRDELNAYVAAVHTEHPNGWTVYRAMGVSVRGRDTETFTLDWPRATRHDREAFAELRRCVDGLAGASRALPDGVDLGRLEGAQWSMAWETELLGVCRRLKEAGAGLGEAVQKLSGELGLSLAGDISSSQLSTLYRFAHELTRPSLPDAELVLHEQLDSLKERLGERGDLLARRDEANRELETALSAFAAALGEPAAEGVTEARKKAYYRLANELVRPDSPPAALVFHDEFSELGGRLATRGDLLVRRQEAWEGVEARGFKSSLVKRLKLEEVEAAWEKACGAFWPLSVFAKGGVKKRLKSYLAAGSAADPEVDLPLLRDHNDAVAALDENLAALRLPAELQSAVDENPGAIEAELQAAERMREVLTAAGLSPSAVGHACGGDLQPLAAAARGLYPPGREVEQLRAALRENLASLGVGPELQSQLEEDGGALESQLTAAERLHAGVVSLGLPDESVSRLLSGHSEQQRGVAAGYCHSAKAFQAAWLDYTKLAGTTPVAAESTEVSYEAQQQADRVLSGRKQLKTWTGLVGARKVAAALGLESMAAALASGEVFPEDAVGRFELAYARWWLPIVVDGCDTLRAFQRHQHEEAVADFRELDELARQAAAPRAKQAIYHDLPPSDQVPRKSELGLLRHQMGLKRPSKSIREVVSGMPESFGKLAPCLLMSPLSIAQYLPADQAQFDVVVFDEASQIATWDAIGAIARGKQTIIVGDPKQLPPTNFFGKADADEENEELDDYEKDLESILDEAQASGLPTLQLNWHYRSRHESLITFSNWNYYGNELVTFPAAESEDRGVSLTHVEGGVYDRGKSRTNRAEAEAIAADLIQRMKRCLTRPEDERLTYGVVTFNSQQQSLIQDLLDEALRETPALEWFFADDRIEPTAVKNLENVQGDERDVMYFSITFGKDTAGKFPVDFGAINRDGGERRLNVAVTRARQTLLVYASFLPDELRAERSQARGVHDLKAFLEYAHRGPVAIAARTEGSVGGYDSPFEEAVAEALSSRGWRLEPQVGVSGFRIDLGVFHPDLPGAYLAGVECDGATYHRSAAARDRDKTRQLVLENLGWTILRVWSPDWWYDSESAVEAVHESLNKLLTASRANRSAATEPPEASDGAPSESSVSVASPPPESGLEWSDSDSIEPPLDFAQATRADDLVESPGKQLVARSATGDEKRQIYETAQLGDASGHQGRFYDEDYSPELRRMALAVVAAEGPVRDDVVAKRIARAHGFARTGARIRDRVLALIPELPATKEGVGRFLWSSDAPHATVPFRYAADEDERRSLDEIPTPELFGLLINRPDIAVSEDPALALAREVGLSRLATAARERLESVIELANNVDAGRPGR
ncbi:MAG: DUF3320 domain-containing protein [Planctomycetota bacterium]